MDVSAPFKEVTLGPAGKRMEVPTDRGISGNEMDIKIRHLRGDCFRGRTDIQFPNGLTRIARMLMEQGSQPDRKGKARCCIGENLFCMKQRRSGGNGI